MPMIIDCIQGTEEWKKARNGLMTASLFEMVMAQKKQGQKTSKYHAVMMKLAGERITGKTVDEGTTLAMRRGIELEPRARILYRTLTHTEPECVGFVLADDRMKGFSPDAFVGTNGVLEIKTKKPEILIPHFYKNDFPAEHKAQCQGGLWIAEREWVDLMLYWPDMPPLIKRAYRDDVYIRKLEGAINRFNEELEHMVHKIKSAETGFSIRIVNALEDQTCQQPEKKAGRRLGERRVGVDVVGRNKRRGNKTRIMRGKRRRGAV
ncbi:hypothetical protein ABID23_000979 [Bartonella silvatica]|uniref:YqaJ viral recombinase domain-containing protein n=1 Tax=Bartonella silvatica TaxID=357760 RepID=A0ABV2HH61_9HYPH